MLNLDFSVAATILYLIVLYVFLSRFFFRPITQILNKRRDLIEGRLEDSRARMEQVERKTSEYEQALRQARVEAYRTQEIERESALAEKADLIAKAKTEADKAVDEGRTRLAAEADAARRKIAADVDTLAKELTTAILRD